MTDRPTEPIAFVDLDAQRRHLGSRVDDAIARVLAHGQFIMGPEVKALEEQLAERCGAAHSVSCSSGTDALLLPLMAWGVGVGDAVFAPAFTFPATPEVAALLGATPVFVDVDPETFTMDPASLAAAFDEAATRGLRSSVVIAVDLYGYPADYETIVDLARERGARVLADAAQSFGAERGGRRVGVMADATATSFFPAKPLGCYGDGGAVLTDDTTLAEIMRSLRVHGQGASKYDIVRIGVNGRLDTIQAAILLEKLAIFDDELKARQRVADAYDAGLRDVVRVPTLAPDVTSAWAQYTIELDGRDDVARRLAAAGVPTGVYYPSPLHRQKPYQECPVSPTGLEVSESLAASVLSLPMHPYLEEAQQEQVIAAVRAAVEVGETAPAS